MALADEFGQAQVDVKGLAERPDNGTLLTLYALYKQGTQGDAGGKRPGLLDPVGRAKYDAWSGLAGTGRDEAQQRYVDLVTELRAAVNR